jgi:hypothetical protein
MKTILGAALGTALLTAGCANPTIPAAPTPVAPTIKETFTSTLPLLGSNEHTFNVAQVGGMQVTLSSVDPTAKIRLGIGTPTGPTCVTIQFVDVGPGAAPQLSGTATITGSFCVSVSDIPPGTLVAPVTYTVNVIHS